jgi:hypothetical protein
MPASNGVSALTMGDRSIETTLRYCVDQNADDVADELWKSFSPSTTDTATSTEERSTRLARSALG